MSDLSHPEVQGSCAPEFIKVRDAFERNFALLNEVGAAVAVYVDDELVVNLWAARPTVPERGPGNKTPSPPCCRAPRG